MKKLLLTAAILSTIAAPVSARVEPHEALKIAIDVATCFNEEGKHEAKVKFHDGRRFHQWVQVKDMRQTSAIEFDVLVPNTQDTGFTWIPTAHFVEVACKEVK